MRKALALLAKRSEIGVAAISLLVVLIFTATSGGIWLSRINMVEVLRVTSVLGIMALGEAFVITSGEIDISLGSVFGVAGMVFLALASQLPAPLAALIALSAGALIGAVNGYVVAYLHIPSLVVTLGSSFMFRGLIYAVLEKTFAFSTTAAMRADPLYRLFGDGRVLGINNALLWALGLLLVLSYVLYLSPFGNRLLAVGGDELSAHSRGVRTRKVKWTVFVIAGLLAGLAGILEASNLGFVDGSFGRQRELQAIAAAVLGGCVLTGGRSSLIGTVLGAFILSGIQSYLVIKAIQPQWFILLMGLSARLQGLYAYNVASLFGLATVIMTYYGVNYYLSGLHSYAAGDPVPVPQWVYIGITVLVTISVLAFIRKRKYALFK